MYRSLEKEIKSLLKKNLSKKKIYTTLATDANKVELTHLLNNLPHTGRKKKTSLVTVFLVILLGLLTIKQVLFVYLHGNTSISLILGFIGPVIHVFVIRELLLNHRLAYQILPLLSILALFRPENRILPDMYMYICMAVLSGLLYLFLFPKSDRMQLPAN